jgi:hypothetical protein|tara:strand:+ start:1979 stop:2680 length:702 start_codon:yes stop_codon:yes gene_type:complete
MEWQPNDETMTWAKEHFASIPTGGIWAPDGAGVQYRKMEEDTFALMMMYNHPDAEDFHQKFMVLFTAAGYKVVEGDEYQVINPPMNADDQARMDIEQKQLLAQGWKCGECGYMLHECNLSSVEHEYVDTVDAPLSDGNTHTIEVWASKIVCGGCGTDIVMEPDDFHLLAGDEHFMQWASESAHYRAMPRHLVKQAADAGDTEVHLMGGEADGQKTPPWLWGLVCKRNAFGEEE